jgi:hypothetical protein
MPLARVQNYEQRYIEEEKIALAYLTKPIFATTAAVLLIGERLTAYKFHNLLQCQLC